MKVDVRVLAASNKDLEKEIGKGQFREDLYYRLNVVPIVVPPLRERREDIPALVQHFMKTHVEEQGLRMKEVSPEAMAVFQQYEWPGNIRRTEEFDRAAHDHGAGVCDRSLPGDAVAYRDEPPLRCRRAITRRIHCLQNPTTRFGTPGMRLKKNTSVVNFANITGIFRGLRKISRSSEAISIARLSCSMWKCDRRAEKDGERINVPHMRRTREAETSCRDGLARTHSARTRKSAQDGRFYMMGTRVSAVAMRRCRAGYDRAR